VGVNSVFADAPNWQKSSHGPLMQNELRQSWVPLANRIDACDNAASLVFATGIALGLMLLSLSITVLPVGALSAVLAQLSLDSKFWFLIILAVIFVPALLAYIVDFFFGNRIRTGSWLARLIALAFRSQRWLPGMAHANAIYQSIRFNLTARGPKLWFSFLVMLPLALGVWTTPLLSRDQSSRLYQAEANSSLLSQPQHYRDQRLGMDRFSMLPFVASREVKEEAIELFVPIRATQVQRITNDCVEFRTLEDASSKDQRDRAWLVCMANLFAPTLDGVRLDDRDVLYSIDASSGLEGLLWRIPNASISAGKHIITVADQRKTEPSQALRPPFRIVVFR
jgi:hypothetical protein